MWWLFTINSFRIQLNFRWGLFLFLFAKILRFTTFSFFLIILLNNTKVLAGYSLNQTILFFLTFNLLDICSQLFLREVYRFRPAVLSGVFDFYLIKPLSPLFRSLFTGADLLDLITLFPLIYAIIFFIIKMNLLNLSNILMYLLMLITGLIIGCSFHIFVLCLGILTTEVDNAIMLYRDIMNMGRMPVDIYTEPIRGLITFIIPVGIMMTFPAKALMGILSLQFLIYAIFFSLLLFYLSIKSWQYALKNYSSAGG